MKAESNIVKFGPRFKDISGQRFGRVVAKTPIPKDRAEKSKHIYWNCECDCGNKFRTSATNLKTGHAKSCGCISKEKASMMRRTHSATSKEAAPIVRRLYRVWDGMKERCSNPNHVGFKDYGGRGIKVCEQWLNFSNFLSDMMPSYKSGLQIERMDNNGDYTPSNCTWATRKQECRNRRSNHMISFNGKIQCISAWAEELNICQYKISRIIRSGRDIIPLFQEKLFRHKSLPFSVEGQPKLNPPEENDLG
jgi:hypothetical protein